MKLKLLHYKIGTKLNRFINNSKISINSNYRNINSFCNINNRYKVLIHNYLINNRHNNSSLNKTIRTSNRPIFKSQVHKLAQIIQVQQIIQKVQLTKKSF